MDIRLQVHCSQTSYAFVLCTFLYYFVQKFKTIAESRVCIVVVCLCDRCVEDNGLVGWIISSHHGNVDATGDSGVVVAAG